mmetsp:Transcript_75266/g.218577  ORF Transcript_75266/g.218577 Transcript_75266/m.218577 type:complete len:295 (+) Transcript_75266:152-1036(+)
MRPSSKSSKKACCERADNLNASPPLSCKTTLRLPCRLMLGPDHEAMWHHQVPNGKRQGDRGHTKRTNCYVQRAAHRTHHDEDEHQGDQYAVQRQHVRVPQVHRQHEEGMQRELGRVQASLARGRRLLVVVIELWPRAPREYDDYACRLHDHDDDQHEPSPGDLRHQHAVLGQGGVHDDRLVLQKSALPLLFRLLRGFSVGRKQRTSGDRRGADGHCVIGEHQLHRHLFLRLLRRQGVCDRLLVILQQRVPVELAHFHPLLPHRCYRCWCPRSRSRSAKAGRTRRLCKGRCPGLT